MHTVQRRGCKKTGDLQIRASLGGFSHSADIQAVVPHNPEILFSIRWEPSEIAWKGPPQDNVPTPTERTAKLSPFALDGKGDRTFFVSGVNVVIANQTKTVIQKTRGHASPSVIGNLRKFPFGVVCPFFQLLNVRISRMNPFLFLISMIIVRNLQFITEI